jgi:hypothetical protein
VNGYLPRCRGLGWQNSIVWLGIAMNVLGEIVQTPYGHGLVLEEKQDHYMIQPMNWVMAG